MKKSIIKTMEGKEKQNFLGYLKSNPPFGYFLLLVLLFFAAQMITELSIGKFELNDFRVYYSAADNFWKSEPVYGVPFGLETGYFKYSPVVLLLFSPFTLFPFELAGAIYYSLNLVLIAFLFYHYFKLIQENFSLARKHNLVFLLLLQYSFVGHFLRELHLGNTNLLLLFFVVILLRFTLKNKFVISGLLLAILMLFKPYLAVLILPLFLAKQFKVLRYGFIFTVGLVLFSLVFFGFSTGFYLHVDWVKSMKDHSDFLSSNNTIFHIFDRIFHTDSPNQIGLPMYAVFSVILFSVFRFTHFFKKFNLNQQLLLFSFLLLALLPNFLVTDTEHFLFSFGLISYLCLYLFEKRKIWPWFIYILLIIFYLGEANLFLPKNIAVEIKLFGTLGIANLLLVGWAVWAILSTQDKKSKLF
ncbi:MAG: glycosyltransferase family 87 protein [Flavobacteriales bacterium]